MRPFYVPEKSVIRLNVALPQRQRVAFHQIALSVPFASYIPMD